MIFFNSRKPKRSYGCKPDPVDHRDYRFRDLAGGTRQTEKLPDRYSLVTASLTPRDQGQTSACTGFAFAQAAECAFAWSGLLTGDLSPAFAYSIGRMQSGTAHSDVGSCNRDVIKAAIRYGIAHETACPFSVRGINKTPSAKAYADAYSRRGVRGYYRLGLKDYDSVKRALYMGFPIVAEFELDAPFENYNGKGIVQAPTGQILGRHALSIVGYERTTFKIVNSWGMSWGDEGFASVSYEWLASGANAWALKLTP